MKVRDAKVVYKKSGSSILFWTGRDNWSGYVDDALLVETLIAIATCGAFNSQRIMFDTEYHFAPLLTAIQELT